LEHENGEARAFYGAVQGRVGIEATGYACLQEWTWQRRIVLLQVRQLNGASSVCPALFPEWERKAKGRATRHPRGRHMAGA